MFMEKEILNSPNRNIVLEYKKKDEKKISKVVITTNDPKLVKTKDDQLINVYDLLSESEEFYIIPIQ